MEATERKQAHLAELAREDKHYKQIARVFGNPDGLDVLEWLLTDLCGYWRGGLESERVIGKYELGRALFNKICIADIGICHNLLDRRRNAAEAVRQDERRRVEGMET